MKTINTDMDWFYLKIYETNLDIGTSKIVYSRYKHLYISKKFIIKL